MKTPLRLESSLPVDVDHVAVAFFGDWQGGCTGHISDVHGMSPPRGTTSSAAARVTR